MNKSLSRYLAVVAVACFCVVGQARGGILIEMVESGSDVVATLSGSINDWYGATLDSSVTYTNLNRVGGLPSTFIFTNNPGSSQTYDVYTGITAPVNFSSSGIYAASSSTASASLVLISSSPSLYIPQSYVLGTPITGQITWNSKTIAGMGLTNGFYFWDWSGDSVTLLINGTAPAPVPEPGQVAASLVLLVGVGGYLFAKRRKSTHSSRTLGSTTA